MPRAASARQQQEDDASKLYPLPKGLTDDCRVPNEHGVVDAQGDFMVELHSLNTLQREPLVDICRILLDGRTLPDGPVKITKRLSKPKAREMLKWLSEGGQARWKEVAKPNNVRSHKGPRSSAANRKKKPSEIMREDMLVEQPSQQLGTRPDLRIAADLALMDQAIIHGCALARKDPKLDPAGRPITQAAGRPIAQARARPSSEFVDPSIMLSSPTNTVASSGLTSLAKPISHADALEALRMHGYTEEMIAEIKVMPGRLHSPAENAMSVEATTEVLSWEQEQETGNVQPDAATANSGGRHDGWPYPPTSSCSAPASTSMRPYSRLPSSSSLATQSSASEYSLGSLDHSMRELRMDTPPAAQIRSVSSSSSASASSSVVSHSSSLLETTARMPSSTHAVFPGSTAIPGSMDIMFMPRTLKLRNGEILTFCHNDLPKTLQFLSFANCIAFLNAVWGPTWAQFKGYTTDQIRFVLLGHAIPLAMWLDVYEGHPHRKELRGRLDVFQAVVAAYRQYESEEEFKQAFPVAQRRYTDAQKAGRQWRNEMATAFAARVKAAIGHTFTLQSPYAILRKYAQQGHLQPNFDAQLLQEINDFHCFV
ncbi:hypothetical protein EV122DRAFT_254092 [Schizophyllum commune]